MVEFLTLNTLTQLSPRTFWIDVVSKRFRITTCLTPTVNRIWLCLGQGSCFLARSVTVLYLHLFRFVSTRDFSHPKLLFSRFEGKRQATIKESHPPDRFLCSSKCAKIWPLVNRFWVNDLDVALFFSGKFYFKIYESLNMTLSLLNFCPFYASGRKK